MGGTERGAPAVPPILELRIHGIRNTPPHELLRSGDVTLTPGDVQLSWGDELAGFYRASGGRAAADAAAGKVVEAYSWGRLARFTGVGMASRIADAVVRTAWFLLMPFGLTNAAYWSRPLPVVRQQSEPAVPPSVVVYSGDVPQGPDGAGRIRLFALVLTLYFVATAAAISLDLIAVQCFPADVPNQEGRACSALPAFLDGLALWSRGQRIALFALLPIVAVGILAGIAYLARTRFHPRPVLGPGTPAASGAASEDGPATPVLMLANLWDARREIRHNGWLHVCAALAATAAIIAWDGFWTRVDGAGCGSVRTFFSDCVPELWSRPVPVAGIAMSVAWLVAVTAVIAAGWETVRKSSDNPEIPAGDGSSRLKPIAVASATSIGTAVLASSMAGDAEDGGGATGMLGLGTAPAGLMAAMLLLIGTMCLLNRNGYNPRSLGWQGKGSAVFSTLALGAATILSCALVGLAAALLQRNFDRRGTTDDGMWRYGPIAGDVLVPPPVFALFSGLLLAVIILAAVVWGLCSRQAVRSMAWNTPEAAVGDLLDAYGAAPPLPRQQAAGRKLVAARRTASLAHRAEAVVSLVAILIFLGLVAALILGIFKDWWAVDAGDLYGAVEGMGFLGLSLAGATILALAVLSARPNSRPLALLWDLMCFMPKTAHPFGPPSYGERAVPEFAARIAAWLDGADGSPPAGTGKVVISAHSLGAVIAIGALFHLKATRPSLPFERIGLVTYGTQLRAYFGRFFPELLGPAILSTAAVARTPLRASGGPAAEREALEGPSGPAYLDLGSILGPGSNRWVNLYRKTDYLGFPVLYQGPGGADVADTDPYAQEMDPFTYQFVVVSHSDYLQAPQYDQAIAAVVDGLPTPPP